MGNFSEGQRVMCIDADLGPGWQVEGAPLVEGAVYTVREAAHGRHIVTEADLGPLVRLAENQVFRPPFPGEMWWQSRRFRALDDVSVSAAACESARIPEPSVG